MIFIDLKYIHALSPRLDKFKKVRDYLYTFRCPFCGDSKKLETKTRGYFYRTKDQMNFRCFNCDKGTTLSKVIEYIDPDLYKEYVKEKFVGKIEEPEYTFEAPKFEKKDPKLRDLVAINSLSRDHPARQVLVKRQIPEKHFDKFFLCHKFCEWAEISNNKDHPRLVIVFLDENGKVFAAQGRAFGNEKPKYLTTKFTDAPKIFGLERVDWSEVVYVVEGPIDSLFLDNALAVAGADFIHLPYEKEAFVVVLDNEPRSTEIVKKMIDLASKDYGLVIWPDTIKLKDLNDMIMDGIDVEEVVRNNTFSGPEARLRVSAWAKV